MPTTDDIPLLINRQEDLDQICMQLQEHRQVALDTEFVRTNTYAPKLGLLQLAFGDVTVCVDPLADMEIARLWSLLFDPDRTSILHSGKQDLEAMWFDQGDIIHNLMDTQVCAGLLGYPAQIGYAGLAKELVDVELDKTQTRTDWTRRPLSDEQLHYAAEDVIYIPQMLEILTDRLRQLGRYEWAVEDSKALCDISLYKPEPADAWQRVKSIPFLPPAQQARARALAAWRESRAVSSDKPRQWIIGDKALLQLAIENPSDDGSLQRLGEIPQALARNQGRKIIGILSAANDSYAQNKSQFQQLAVDTEKEKALSKKLSGLVRHTAEQLGIAAEILASKRDINALIRNPDNTRLLQGWRRAVIGDELLEIST